MSNSNALPPQQKWRTAACILLYIIASVKLAIMLWSTNKGFDIGDEGLYMLSLKDPDRYNVLAHGKILNTILPIKNFTIPISRTISIVLEMLSGIVFSFGLAHWLKQRFSNALSFWHIWAVVLAGSFSSLLARCVSYNDLVNFCGVASAGLMLYSLDQKRTYIKLALWTITFSLVSFCAVFKTPVVISLSALYLLAIVLYNIGKPKLKVLGYSLLGLVFGFAITAMVYTAIYKGIGWIDVIAKVKHTADLLNYKPIDLILMYIVFDALPNLLFIGIGTAIFGIINFTIKKLSSVSSSVRLGLSSIFTVPAGIVVIYLLNFLLIPEERAPYPFLWILVCTVLLMLFQIKKHTDQLQFKSWVVVGVLIALPVGMIGGTNGFITETLFTYWTPWFGLLTIGAYYLTGTKLHLLKYHIVTPIIGVLMLLLFVQVKVLHPFGMVKGENVLSQTEPFNSTDNILLDTATHRYFTQISELIRTNYKDEKPAILAMNYTPGIVYLTNGYSPGAPFYIFHKDFNNYNCFNVEQVPANSTIPIIIYRSSIQADVWQCLTEKTWGFPDDYKTLTIVDPYAAVHETSEPTDGLLYICFPQ